MREIKFRGKSVDGKWIYGSLLQTKTLSFICKAMSKVKTRNYLIEKQETIGEYTGLKDKNGVEIYEGDILEYMAIADGKQRDKVIFDRGTFVVDYSEDYKQPVNEINHCAEVIGNIYDNPELIEKEGNANE